jgi:hypothetical protein
MELHKGTMEAYLAAVEANHGAGEAAITQRTYSLSLLLSVEASNVPG